MFYTRFVTIMCYYGLTSTAATLSSDVYSNFQYAMVAEVDFACFLAISRRFNILKMYAMVAEVGLACLL